jgi:hypothetical protein
MRKKDLEAEYKRMLACSDQMTTMLSALTQQNTRFNEEVRTRLEEIGASDSRKKIRTKPMLSPEAQIDLRSRMLGHLNGNGPVRS